MKLKLVINSSEAHEDYKLLRTTISTVASLRKTAVLRFNSERLIIISTPKATLGSTAGSVLHGDTGQLWCTIPKDVFKLYTVISARELNGITMEYNCDSLLSVFRRYDKVMSQNSMSNMTIKLQSMPEWNVQSNIPNSDSALKPNPVCALGMTFEEIVGAGGNGIDNSNLDNEYGTTSVTMNGSNKIILHSFKVPVRLLFRSQDAKIQEPMINYTNLVMYRLPVISSEYGNGFYNFIRRVERYTNVNHVRLSGKQQISDSSNLDAELKIIVNELDWHLDICWDGALSIVPQENEQEAQNNEPTQDTNASQEDPAMSVQSHVHSEVNSLQIDDSDLMESRNQSLNGSKNFDDNMGVSLDNVSTMVEKAERENTLINEVVIRSKDWRVCAKLYNAFEEVVLAISHDESCVFHCSLDRGNLDKYDDATQEEKPRERGQIIYYMARSKSLQ